jgi:hypothetical protein
LLRVVLFVISFAFASLAMGIIGILLVELSQSYVSIPPEESTSYGAFFVLMLLPSLFAVGGLHGLGVAIATQHDVRFGLAFLMILSIVSACLFVQSGYRQSNAGHDHRMVELYAPLVLVSAAPLLSTVVLALLEVRSRRSKHLTR